MPNPTGPELFEYADNSHHRSNAAPYGSPDEAYFDKRAAFLSGQANTAALVMLAEIIATATGVDHYDLDAWRRAIPLAPLAQCRSLTIRRPACAERHTADCAYTDPEPEPKHELLPVGTRVLVSSWSLDDDGHTKIHGQPVPGKIVGYDMGKTKYRWRTEYGPGHYATTDQWAFVNNSVQVHPDDPECPPEPEPAPPTPRVYVEHRNGRQGWITEGATNGVGKHRVTVHFLGHGQESGIRLDDLKFITADDIDRCQSGQDRDECRETDLCEPCQQAEDNEAEDIERSIGLR